MRKVYKFQINYFDMSNNINHEMVYATTKKHAENYFKTRYFYKEIINIHKHKK